MAAYAPLVPPAGCASPLRADGNSDTNTLLLQRPFTASGARKTRHVAVLVHWGEHFDQLVHDELHGDEQLNTYVALRSSHQPNQLAPVDRHEDDGPINYELRSSAFATTRVVERSTCPMWNEVLLVPLPVEWRQQPDAAAWKLHVDVVRRDSSQQEDSLLATVALSMEMLVKPCVSHHVAIDLAPPTTAYPMPRAFFSLSDTDDWDDSDTVCEVVVQDMEAFTTESQQTQSGVILMLSTIPKETSLNLKDLFKAPSNMETTTTSSGDYVWITPTARDKLVDGTNCKRVQWGYPVLFSQNTINQVHVNGVVYAYAYSVVPSGESYAFQCVGSTTLALDAVPLDGTATSLSHTLTSISDSTQDSKRSMLHTTVRCWNGPAWANFQRMSVSRRVIITNRRHRKRIELQALEWTGALCRGLNRYPISSLCDEGGLSSLLARYLASTPALQDNNTDSSPTESSETQGMQQSNDLLHHHVSLLQQEIMAKQDTIQKLLRDADANAIALRKCGVELVAARKEVHKRDELISQLQAKLRDIEQRDADQTRELLATTGAITGLRLDSQVTQRLNMLIFKYKELDQRHTGTQAELADAKRVVTTFKQLQSQYADLEQAHVVQAGLVQRLQKDKAQQGELQRTIRMQEKVIRKLEKAMASHPKPSQDASETQAREPTIQAAATTVEADSPLMAVRLQVLEQQLQTNAKAAASEISRLKMRVLELETQLTGDTVANASPKRRPDR